MGLGRMWRRLAAEPVVALGTVVTVALALTLLAAGPIYSEAVAVGALRQSLEDAPASTTAIQMSITATNDQVETLEEVADEVLDDTLRSVPADRSQLLQSGESFELPQQLDPDRVDVAVFAWLDGVADEVVLLDGAWPSSTSDAVEVIVDSSAAQQLQVGIGDEMSLPARSGDADDVDTVVVGVYEVVDAFAPYWQGRPRIVEPISVSPSFRTVSLLTDRDAMLGGISARPVVETLAIPSFEQIELADVEPLRRRVSNISSTAQRELDEVSPPVEREFEIDTSLGSVLIDRDRTLTVARSVVLAVILQLAVLAAFALVLVAGLGVEARESESAMLRARGAGVAQLTTRALIDAAVIVVPLALVSPYVAASIVGVFDDVGPLTAVGLTIDPEPVAGAWWLVGIASVLTVLILTWPTLRAARARDSADSRRRSRWSGVVQRSGLDVALLALAALSYWQLRTLGDDRAASIRGRFGVDPVLIVAPTFGLLAGTMLALRVIPAMARAAERFIARGRSATVALSGWQLARRPARYSRSGLLVIMALAIGTFAAIYDATWTVSQSAQARHEVGADARVEPNRRTGDSITPLQLADAIEAVPDVDVASPVILGEADMPGVDRPGTLVALVGHEAVTSDLRNWAEVTDAIDQLVERRRVPDAIELPGSPVSIVLPVNVTVDEPATADPDDPDQPDEIPVSGSLSVLLRDGNGVVHRMDLGLIGVGESERVILLASEFGDPSNPPTPTPPVSLVDIRLNTVTQGPTNRRAEIAIGPLQVTDESGVQQQIDLTERGLQPTSDVLGFLAQPASFSFSAEAPPGGLGVAVETGSSFLAVPVVFTISAPFGDAPLPAVVTNDWLEASSTSIGDVVSVPLGRVDSRRVEVIDAVDSVPTVDPTTNEALLVDLPTLLAVEQEPGSPDRDITEYWLAAPRSDSALSDALIREPIEAAGVVLLSERRQELLSDPPALSSIGALTMGFVAAATFALAGFLVTAVVSAQERRNEFALLAALGLTRRQHRSWMFLEQLVMLLVGAVTGTVLGLLLAQLVLPTASLSQDGSAVYPPVEVTVPWGAVALLEVVIVGGLMLGVAAVTLFGRTPSEAEAIRQGVGT